jgi:hypothetical protein
MDWQLGLLGLVMLLGFFVVNRTLERIEHLLVELRDGRRD